MRCYNCHVEIMGKEKYCRKCGTDLTALSKSLVASQAKLPALLYRSLVPRRIATGMSALALGIGIELLRRNVLPYLRLRWAKKPAIPAITVDGLKDMLFSRSEKSVKLPKGYELHETVVYMSRVVRKKN
jgi:hypothetical protein